MRSVLAVTLLVAAAAAHAADPSPSAIASAKQAVTEGRAARDAGDHKQARDKFKAAWAYVQTPIIGVDLAKEHIALGELIEARAACLEVTKLAPAPKESPEGKAARDEAARLADELRGRIPSLVIEVKPSTAKVTLDGEPVAGGTFGTPRLVNPGKHVLKGMVGVKEKKFAVTVAEGETKKVEIDMTVADAAPEDPPPGPALPEPGPGPKSGPVDQGEPTGSYSPITWVGFGVGALGIGVGAVTGLMSMSKVKSLKTSCTDFKCPPTSYATYDSAQQLGTVSTVAFIVGGAGVALGVYGLISGRSEPTHATGIRPWIGIGSVGVNGAF